MEHPVNIIKFDYDKISPITGNKSVIVTTEEEMCMESGYLSSNGMHLKNSEQIREFEAGAPSILRETRFVESSGKVWYKLLATQGNHVIYPEIYDGDPIWKVGQYRDLKENEVAGPKRLNQVISNEKVRVIDDENSMIFEEFPEAYDYFYKLINTDRNED